MREHYVCIKVVRYGACPAHQEIPGEAEAMNAGRTYEVSGLKVYATPVAINEPQTPYMKRPSQPSLIYLLPGLTPNSQPVGGS